MRMVCSVRVSELKLGGIRTSLPAPQASEATAWPLPRALEALLWQLQGLDADPVFNHFPAFTDGMLS